jgi:hypothetical protein
MSCEPLASGPELKYQVSYFLVRASGSKLTARSFSMLRDRAHASP